MKYRLLILFFLLIPVSLFGIIAYPYKVQVKTNSGYAYITIKGDEHFKYAVTEDGFYVIQDSDGWKYLKRCPEGNLMLSEFSLESREYRSSELKDFLNSKQSVRHFRHEDLKNVHKNHLHTPFINKSASPVVGSRKVLIVLMQFSDHAFLKSRSDFFDLFNENNYSADGAMGSVYNYYKYVSYGKLDLQCDVIGPFTASHDMAYYGKNVGMDGHDKNPYELFKEATQFASSAVSLEDYDADNNGFVDNFHIIYAGYGEEAGAEYNTIWAHESTFEPIYVDGMKIDRYSCAPELRSNHGSGISRIGPHCHEIGHALGAMDYYDTNYYEGGYFNGTGDWDVMASGSWNNTGISPANFNPYVKAYNFGWQNVITLDTDASIEFLPSSFSDVIYRINTPINGDYFLLENRCQDSFDIKSPGHGLLIFHLGSELDNLSKINEINASFPQNCYIVCASSPYALPSSSPSSYGEINSSGTPFPGSSLKSEFTANSIPAALTMNNTVTNFSLKNIHEIDNSIVTFDFTLEDNDTEERPEENTDIPTNGEIVWEEDFSNWTNSIEWTQEFNIGRTLWVKRMISQQGIVHFMELSNSSSPWDEGDNIISTSLISPTVNVTESDYVLSFDVSKSSQNVKADTLSVLLRDGNELGKVILSSNNWETKKYIIHKGSLLNSLVFKGYVHLSSAIRLTNIELRKIEATGMTRKVNNENQTIPIAYFDIFGRMILSEALPKGIVIIKMSDGTYKKAFIE